MMNLKKYFRRHFFPFLVYWLYRLWSFSWRIHLDEPPEMQKALKNNQPFILAHWHGDELALLVLAKRYRIATMTSTSQDGELMNYVLKKLGAKTSRGSSTRGSISALRGLLNLMKKGNNGSMAVDGPKGPLHKVKPGVFELSRLTKAPIFAGGVSCSNALVFKNAWNKARLPMPFSKIVVKWAEPIAFIDKTQDLRSRQLALKLEESIHTARQQALNLIVKEGGR